MRKARLLLAVPAATALVFTGVAPAWAGGDDGNHNDDAWAEVLEIDDEAELENGGDELEVSFKYKCEDNDEDVTADVTAENDARYEKTDIDLDCDGDEHRKTVDLEKKNHDEAEEGDELDVTVTINANGDELDELTEEVKVVDDDNDDHDDDNDHDDDDDDDNDHDDKHDDKDDDHHNGH